MSATQTPASVNPVNSNKDVTSVSKEKSNAGNGDAEPLGEVASGGNGNGKPAVSMAKSPSLQKASSSISFGSMHSDQDQATAGVLSSSPSASQPIRLSSGAPAKFGSVSATSIKSESAIATGQSGSAVRSLDFNKLFQTSGAPAAKQVNGKNVTTTESGAEVTPPAAVRTNASTGSATRPTANPVATNPAAAMANRPHEAQRTAAQSSQPAHSAPGAGLQQRVTPSTAYGVHHQQQPRSPHMSSQNAHMHPMHHLNGTSPGWQGGQPQMYYHNMYPTNAYGGYPGMPGIPPHMGQQWGTQLPGSPYDQNQTRSPRHPPAGVSHSVGTATPSLTSASSVSTPHGGLASPAGSQRNLQQQQTPSTMGSPQAPHIGMGLPQSRSSGFHSLSASGSFVPQSPTNSMSASARQFEPAPFQKRVSSAIKIVNPNTKTPVQLPPKKEQAAPSTPTSATAVPVTAPTSTPTLQTPSAATASPASLPRATSTANIVPPSVPASPAPAIPSAAASIQTTEDFMKRVKAKADEAKRLKEEKAAAEKIAAEASKAGVVSDQIEVEEAKPESAPGSDKQKDDLQGAPSTVTETPVKSHSQTEKHSSSPEVRLPVSHNETAAADSSGVGGATQAIIALTIDEKAANGRSQEPSLETPNGKSAARADAERAAEDLSSVPSTPMEGSTAKFPPTPRTPSTPGFANLPAKPVVSLGGSGAGSSNPATTNASSATAVQATSADAVATTSGDGSGMKPEDDKREDSKRKSSTVSPFDQTNTQDEEISASDAPQASTASAALGSAKFIDDLTKVSYPDKIQSPRAGLNETAEPGKFRYDRDFLLQFMGVYKDKPVDLPPLASIGMDGNQALPARGSATRKSSGMGPPAAPGRSGSIGMGFGSGFGGGKGGMGQFSHPGKTSEERFAASNARGSVGSFGNSGPMGAFNAGARSQPLSRTGSGSNAIPTREAMGTGIPSGGRTTSRKGKDRRDPGRSGVNPPEKGGPTIPMDQVVPLTNSENRWVGGRGQSVKADTPELVTRKVKALLNKLTLEKFDSISMQILEWANKSVDETDGQTLRMVIALIFEKATDEAAWSEMYATLCRKIMEKLDPNIQDENIKTNDDKPVMGGHLFRKYLVNRCQEDFERGWAHRESTMAAAKSKEAEDLLKKAQIEKEAADAKDAEERGEKPGEQKEAVLLSDEYYEAQKAKRRGLGLVRFIGELFKFQMLSEKIMHLCVQRLLNNVDTPEEEEIESLCKLLTTIGKLLEEGKARGLMVKYFERMDQMMNSPAMTPRMRFMLQDVIELRHHNWKPRHDNAAPKTIAQIHEDAAKAKVQAEMDRVSRMHMGGPMSRGGSRRGQQREQYGADGFITVGNQPAAPAHQSKVGNLSGFGKGIDRSGASRPLSVGPQSVFARKNQKSDDGSNPPSRTASSQNIFSLLSANAEGSDPAPTEESAVGGRRKLNLAKRTKPLPGQEGEANNPESGTGQEEGEDDEEEEEDVADDGDHADVEDNGAGGATGDMGEEEAQRRISNDVKELLAIRNVDEGRMALESLPSTHRAEFINKIVEAVLNRKEEDVKMVGEVFNSARSSNLIDDEIVEKGVKDHVEYLDDISIDVPNAYSFMAILLVSTGLSSERIEALAATIQGEGVKPPKDRLMAKVNEL